MTNQYFSQANKIFPDAGIKAQHHQLIISDFAVADFNLDGYMDMVFVDVYQDDLYISFGNKNQSFGDAFFELKRTMLVDMGSVRMTSPKIQVLDMNKDGKPDLIVSGAHESRELSNAFIFYNIIKTESNSSTISITATITNTSTVPTDTTSSSSSSTIDATTMFKLVESTDATDTFTTTTKTTRTKTTTTTDTSTTGTMITTTATTTNGVAEVAEEENRKSDVSFDAEMKANIALGFGVGSFLLLVGGFAYINHKINNMKHCTTLPKPIAVVNPSYTNGITTPKVEEAFYEEPAQTAYSTVGEQQTYIVGRETYENLDV